MSVVDDFTGFSFSSLPDLETGKKAEIPKTNPLDLVKSETEAVSERIRLSIITDIPVLSHAATYFFTLGSEGKRFRPSLILLLATSLSPIPPSPDRTVVDTRPSNIYVPEIRRRQQRLAEISELIHVTSLLHDDVIDKAETRRGKKSLNSDVGNKVAVLAGDFLLARASVTLASLQNPEVIMLVAQILENLVSGEIMQMTGTEADFTDLKYYASKTFNKTASLMANCCKAVSILGEQTSQVCELASEYGKHLGMAFQITDDILDFTSTSNEMGKPVLNDLTSGISTAPVLFALQHYPELKPLILRKFREQGDVEKAVELVQRGHGIERSRELAVEHIKKAQEKVHQFPPVLHKEAEIARQGLLDLTELVLNRKK